MKKLIELDAALNGVANLLDYEIVKGHSGAVSRAGVMHILTALPTVDSVPVVRCKGCRHCQYDSIFGSYWCGGRLGGIEVEADFFCKDGEQHDS